MSFADEQEEIAAQYLKTDLSNLPDWAQEAGKRAEAATEGPWVTGPTPRYLMMMQEMDGSARQENPLTLRSPAHTEELVTVWNYLLPATANAIFIAAARTDIPRILAAWAEDKAKLQMLEAEIEEHRQWSQDKTVRLARAVELLRRKHKDDYQNLHSAPHRSSIDRDIHTFLQEEDARK